MKSGSNKFYIFLFLMTLLMWGGVVFLLGIPGVILFALTDFLPSKVLGSLGGDNAHSAGIRFSILWPFFISMAYLVSKMEIVDKRVSFRDGEFYVLKFVLFLILFTFLLTIGIHNYLLNN